LNAEGQSGVHRPVSTQVEPFDGYVLVHLNWNLMQA
jgi:hypothetical protein